MELSRFRLGRYIRIVTGHNNLLYHRSNINPDIDPMCRFCNETQETFIHFISDCPALWQEQRQLQAEVQDQSVYMAPPEALLDFAANPRINAALENASEVDRIWGLERSQSDGQQSESGTEQAEEDGLESMSVAEEGDNDEERVIRDTEDRENRRRGIWDQEADSDMEEADTGMDMD